MSLVLIGPCWNKSVPLECTNINVHTTPLKAVHTFQHLYSQIHASTLLPFLTFHFSRGSTRSAAQPEDTSYAAACTPTYPRLTHQLSMHTMEKTNIIKSYYFWIVIFSIFVVSMYTIYFWHWSVRIKKLRNVIIACPVLLTFSFKIVGCDITVNLPSFWQWAR